MASWKMPLRLSWLHILLISWLVAIASSRELYQRELSGFLRVRDDADYDPSENPPSCFTICGLNSAIDNNAKRSLCDRAGEGCPVRRTLEERTFGLLLPSDNGSDFLSVQKRVLRPIDGDTIDNWMVGTTDGDDGQGTRSIDIVTYGAGGTPQSSTVSQAFGNEAFNMVTKYIHGCTVICVWSRKGAWCGHYWQFLAFSAPPDYKTPNFKLELQQSIISVGNTRAVGPRLASVADWFTINQNDPPEQRNRVFAFVMSPRRWNGGEGTFQYSKKMPLIQAAINTAIPAIAAADVKLYDYVPVDADPDDPTETTELDSTARGRVVLQYDPNADGNGAKGTRLIYERGDRAGLNFQEDKWTVDPS